MSSRSSNTERAKWRAECREILAKHIKEALELTIDAGDVRLMPGQNDPYIWDVAPEKEHLFKKQLSKHSIGPLLELIREVGISFQAVRRARGTVQSETKEPLRLSEARKLQSENAALVEEVRSLRVRAEAAESRIEQLVGALEALKQRDASMTALMTKYGGMMLHFVHESASIGQLQPPHEADITRQWYLESPDGS